LRLRSSTSSNSIPTLDRLGEFRLNSFTSTYDEEGRPICRDGELLFDSAYRFKGQCAPCFVLTEIDFDIVDEAVLRRLFCGRHTCHDEARARYVRACGSRGDCHAVSLAIGTKNVPSYPYSSPQAKELF
jgi:hypothetical protein